MYEYMLPLFWGRKPKGMLDAFQEIYISQAENGRSNEWEENDGDFF